MDCAYKRCVNQGACEIYKEAHQLGSEEDKKELLIDILKKAESC